MMRKQVFSSSIVLVLISFCFCGLFCSSPSPRITDFSASNNEIQSGGSAHISWNISGATSVNIDPGIGQVPASGIRKVSPSSDTTYILTAREGAQSVTKSISIKVITPASVQPSSANTSGQASAPIVSAPSTTPQKRIKLNMTLPEKLYFRNQYDLKIEVSNISGNPINKLKVYEKRAESGNFPLRRCDVLVTLTPPDLYTIDVGNLAPNEKFETTCYMYVQTTKEDVQGKSVNFDCYYSIDNGEKIYGGKLIITLDPTSQYWTVENKFE